MNRHTTLLLILTLLLCPVMAQAQSYHDSIVIVVDGSGSMLDKMNDRTGRRIEKMVAAKTTLKSVLMEVPTQTWVGIYTFAKNKRWWSYPLGPVNQQRIVQAIDSINPDGGTPLGEALKEAADRLLQERDTQQNLGRYQIVVVTDGEAQDKGYMLKVAQAIKQRHLKLDVIGVDMPGGARHSLANSADSYQSAADATQLLQAVRKAIIVEAGGDDLKADFDLTADIPPEVARLWIAGILEPPKAPPASVRAPARQANVPIGSAPGETEVKPDACSASSGPVTTGTALILLMLFSSMILHRRFRTA